MILGFAKKSSCQTKLPLLSNWASSNSWLWTPVDSDICEGSGNRTHVANEDQPVLQSSTFQSIGWNPLVGYKPKRSGSWSRLSWLHTHVLIWLQIWIAHPCVYLAPEAPVFSGGFYGLATHYTGLHGPQWECPSEISSFGSHISFFWSGLERLLWDIMRSTKACRSIFFPGWEMPLAPPGASQLRAR